MKPQLENGYLKLANELIDEFAKIQLSPNEWRILWCVLRKTYGYNKKEDSISLTQFQEYTNLSRPSTTKAISKLVAKQILVANRLPFINKYNLNKDNKQWISSYIDTSSHFATRVVAIQQPKLVAIQQHTKDNKNNITKDILLRNRESYGNPDINLVSKYFLNVMQIPKEDCTQKQSRQYWNLLLKESKKGTEGVCWLIDLAKSDPFYSSNITSSKDLYYKRVKLISRKRDSKGGIADGRNIV